MTTMISDLPRDLIEEIFCRVPMKFMRAVHLTCKKWNTLSKSESLAKKRIGKAKDETMMIMLKNNNLYLSSVVINVDPSIEIKGKLTCLDEQVKISEVFNCEGLLLCVLKDTSRLVFWNPYRGQTRCLEHVSPHGPHHHRWSYALGYVNTMDESCPTHKILRFYYHHRYFFEIYDFDSDLWRILYVTPISCRLMCSNRGVSLKGNTFWCAQDEEYKKIIHLICFDFTAERFGPLLPMPLPFNNGNRGEFVSLSHASTREGKLAVLRYYKNVTEIWITTELEAEKVSWIKFLKVDGRRFTCFYGNFFIDEEKKLAMGFDFKFDIIGEAGYYKKVESEEQKYLNSSCVYSYVPSLMQIKSSRRRRRRRRGKKRN